MENYPGLTEPGVRYFLCEILKQCKEKKYALYSRIFNITIFILFVLVLGGILYYRHKGKMTEVEKKRRQKTEEVYMIEKIKSIQQKGVKNQNHIITDLPKLSSGFDVLHKNFYDV
jgi:hypothetical protein